MNIYVSNFDTQWTEQDLNNLFSPYGTVTKTLVMMDAFTERSRGFGYVAMPDEEEAAKAIEALHQSVQNGYKLEVAKGEPKEQRKGSYKVGNGGINPYRFKKS